MLTFKLAKRTDIWLHTKDIPGSHVVIHSSEPDETTLREAATLAAYFSKARESSSVPVDYTEIRQVKNQMVPNQVSSSILNKRHCILTLMRQSFYS